MNEESMTDDFVKNLERLPQELRIPPCIGLEIIDLLERSEIPAIKSVLSDEYFWRLKLQYDFPDLVEFVGKDLPPWVLAVPGSAEEMEQKNSPYKPWRRYYYTARYFMRLTYKTLINFAVRWAHLPGTVDGVTLPAQRYSFQNDCRMVPGKTRLVSGSVSTMVYADATRRGPIETFVMDINAFCAKYLLYDVGLSFYLYNVIDRLSPWHYSRNPNSVNPIRTLMTQVSWYEDITAKSIFSTSLATFFKEKKLSKFMGWILHLNPVFDPFDRTADRAGDFPYSPLVRSVRSNVWVRGSSAPNLVRRTSLTTVEETTEYMQALTMSTLWDCMQHSLLEPGELRMPQYDENYLRYRASYAGIPKDPTGRNLIGLPFSAHVASTGGGGSVDGDLIGCNGQPLTLKRSEVVHLIDQVAKNNKARLHLPLIQSQDMQIMAMAVADLEVPMETHSDMSQLLVVVEGTALLTVKATQTERGEDMRCLPVSHHMQAGDAYLIPRRTPHQIQNTSSDGQILRMFTVYSPPNHKE